MSTLDRIDHALAVQDAVDFGDADWLPGDPLYSRPRGDWLGEQTIRPMFQVYDETTWLVARCDPCGVSWIGDAPCWVCGTEQLLVKAPSFVASGYSWASGVVAAAARFEESMAEARAVYAAYFDEAALLAIAETPEPPRFVSRGDVRVAFLPAVANPMAPTVAELAAATPLDGIVHWRDLVQPDPYQEIAARAAEADLTERRDRAVSIEPPDPDDTVTRRGFFGELTLARPRYPRPDAALGELDGGVS